MPLLVIFAILLVITPFLTLFLLVKYGKLRADLDESKEELARQNRAFQREIADLKKQIASSGPVVPSPKEKPLQQPTAAAPPREIPLPPSRVDFPPPVQVPPSAVLPPQKTPVPLAPAKTPVDVKPAFPSAPQKVSPPVTPVAPPPAPNPPSWSIQASPPQPQTPRGLQASPQPPGETP